MKINPPTVAELIAKLQTMPQDLPVYLRSKYTGETDPFEDYPVNINGVSKMEGNETTTALFRPNQPNEWVAMLF